MSSAPLPLTTLFLSIEPANFVIATRQEVRVTTEGPLNGLNSPTQILSILLNRFFLSRETCPLFSLFFLALFFGKSFQTFFLFPFGVEDSLDDFTLYSFLFEARFCLDEISFRLFS